MPIAIARAALLLAVAAMLSCRDTMVPEWELRVAEGQWATRGSESYRFTVARQCFCTEEMTGPVVVDVANGVITALHYEATGAPVPERVAGLFPTIDGLFEIVRSARRSRDTQLAVVFHPTYGYPTRIEIDVDQMPVDGGTILLARDLVLR